MCLQLYETFQVVDQCWIFRIPLHLVLQSRVTWFLVLVYRCFHPILRSLCFLIDSSSLVSIWLTEHYFSLLCTFCSIVKFLQELLVLLYRLLFHFFLFLFRKLLLEQLCSRNASFFNEDSRLQPTVGYVKLTLNLLPNVMKFVDGVAKL